MNNKTISLGNLAELIGGKVCGDSDLLIEGFSSLEMAGPGDITFVGKCDGSKLHEMTKASAVIVSLKIDSASLPVIQVGDQNLAGAKAHNYFLEENFIAKGIHDRAVIGENCKISSEITIKPNVTIGNACEIGARTIIEPGVVIDDRVVIGEDCIIKSNVTIEHDCSIGNEVTLHAGVVIGSDGFGYATDQLGNHVKRPQVGTVVIGDNVEIGANCCVDRATFGITEIQSGTKLDNLVQVAHNTNIGPNCIIVAQVALAGSVNLGRNVVIGGQAAVSGHNTLADGVMVAAKSGVHTDLPKGAVVGGTPSMPVKQWAKASSVFARLPELRKEVRTLRKELDLIKNIKD